MADYEIEALFEYSQVCCNKNTKKSTRCKEKEERIEIAELGCATPGYAEKIQVFT